MSIEKPSQPNEHNKNKFELSAQIYEDGGKILKLVIAGPFAKSKEIEEQEKKIEEIIGKKIISSQTSTSSDSEPEPWVCEINDEDLEKLKKAGFVE
ncbi:MAG: hypothetical protein L6Q29_00630 [Candidatus Pacebacteria bacterium]|nr:hypothetical protein [Candidatus Paceibacterota bacterium]